jgi:large subunit ribosomal protein L10
MAIAKKKMTRARKKQDITEIKDKLQRANGVILTDFTGLNVEEISQLRKKLHNAQIDYRVCKNRLIKIAFKEAKYDQIDPMLDGSTALAFAYEEPTEAAKVLVEFAKENEKLRIKGGFLEKKSIGVKVVQELASIPSRMELLTRFSWGLKSPITSLVYLLKNATSRVVYAVADYARLEEQKQSK